MICKERDQRKHNDQDKYAGAGVKAEEQMAFYLRRAFADDPEAWVFHDLRLAVAEDVAQIDHLVLHRSGFILVESKSVTSKVRIHPNGEWERLWNNHWQGMASPIKQAERQAEFLRKHLQADREKLLGKILFGKLQQGFQNMPMEILVAISDSGSIDRKGEFPDVSKADLIPDRVREILQRHKKARGIFSVNLDIKNNDGLHNLKDQEIEAIRTWLLAHHRPAEKSVAVVPLPPAEPKKQPTYSVVPPSAPVVKETAPVAAASTGQLGKCAKCGGGSEILWGKYGYYWKCPQCQSNMPIKEYCPTCKGKLRLRKDQSRFYKYCEPCKSAESLYWEASN